jgi:hypothetical protein
MKIRMTTETLKTENLKPDFGVSAFPHFSVSAFQRFSVSAVCTLGLSMFALSQAAAKDATALELAKEGNRYLGEQSKDKVVQIHSDKSIAGLTPDIWHVVYYDPDTTLKAIEVKFVSGKKADVSRPLRLLEPIRGGDAPLSREKLKTDSDAALEIARKEPLLEKLTLKASRLTLTRYGHDDSTPVWKVRFWAAKLKHPEDDADIGEVIISAEDGKVLKADLKPERVR